MFIREVQTFQNDAVRVHSQYLADRRIIEQKELYYQKESSRLVARLNGTPGQKQVVSEIIIVFTYGLQVENIYEAVNNFISNSNVKYQLLKTQTTRLGELEDTIKLLQNDKNTMADQIDLMKKKEETDLRQYELLEDRLDKWEGQIGWYHPKVEGGEERVGAGERDGLNQ